MLSQYLVRSKDTLGSTASLLYTINTFGAAAGALAAGFFLPLLLGFTNSYWVAIATTATVAIIAWLLDRRDNAALTAIATEKTEARKPQLCTETLSLSKVSNLAFLSGFLTLGLEVLWTRMFSQVLQNSVYTFSTILVTFLVALAIGAKLAHGLIRRQFGAVPVLFALMAASAILVVLSPLLFSWLNDGVDYLGGKRSWGAYMAVVFASAGAVMLLPGIIMGSIFPYLIKLSEHFDFGPGQTVGKLAAINTFGAVLGSLCAGFLLLELFGLWSSIVAGIYLLAAISIATHLAKRRLAYTAVVTISIPVILISVYASDIPLVKIDADNKKEKIIRVWEGSAAHVAVVDQPLTRRIKVNNHYGLGGTGVHKHEERQSHLALLLHPDPRSVFYLGMGTGITAGAALQHPVERVVVTEIVPEVVMATREYFSPYLHGLYTDTRAEVIVEDGRNYLLGTNETFDIIIADLFVPWKAGTGSLYSKEHYLAAIARLNEGGIYAQWLPLFQLSEENLGSIARTMLEVFPQVTVWRSKFQSTYPIILLAGHTDTSPLDISSLRKNLANVKRDMPAETSSNSIGRSALPGNVDEFLLHYGGNLTNAQDIMIQYPVNTDDRPVVEYQAPIAHRRKKAGQVGWVTGTELIQFYEILSRVTPFENDPYLGALSNRQKRLVNAGLDLHRSRIMNAEGDQSAARKVFQRFKSVYD